MFKYGLATAANRTAVESIWRYVACSVEGSPLDRVRSSVSPIRIGILHSLRKRRRRCACVWGYFVWPLFVCVIDKRIGECV